MKRLFYDLRIDFYNDLAVATINVLGYILKRKDFHTTMGYSEFNIVLAILYVGMDQRGPIPPVRGFSAARRDAFDSKPTATASAASVPRPDEKPDQSAAHRDRRRPRRSRPRTPGRGSCPRCPCPDARVAPLIPFRETSPLFFWNTANVAEGSTPVASLSAMSVRSGEGFWTPAPTRHGAPPRGRRSKASQGGNRGQDGRCLAGRDLWGFESQGRLARVAAGACGLGRGGLGEDDRRV